MTLPRQEITVLDPSLGLVEPSSDTPVYIGHSPLHAAGEFLVVSQPSDVRSALGYGALAEDVARALREGGGPVYVITTDAAAGTVTAPVVDTEETIAAAVTGTPAMDAAVLIQITRSGALGAARYRYSLDDYGVANPTLSRELVVPLSGAITIPGVGLTVTLTPDVGPPVAELTEGDTIRFEALEGAPVPVDIEGAFSIIDGIVGYSPALVFVSGIQADASDGEGAFIALAGLLSDLENGYKFARGYVDVGSRDTWQNVLTESDGYSNVRVGACYGLAVSASVAPFEGCANVRVSALNPLAARAHRTLISTDQARFVEGSLDGIRAVNFDSFKNETLDDAGISTLRTWPGVAGYYVGNGRLKGPFGSDYQYLQYGRVMDAACRTAYEAALPFMSEGLRGVAGGTLSPLDAADVQTAVFRALAAQLLEQSNARGTGGHVSAIEVTVDLTNAFVQTGVLKVTIGILPLGYARTIQTTLGFTVGSQN